MRERLKGITVAAADTSGASTNSRIGGDGSGEHQPDDDGREDNSEPCKRKLAALLIEMIEDVARRPGRVDDTRHMVVDDHGIAENT